jgi:hypothetical protein
LLSKRLEALPADMALLFYIPKDPVLGKFN